MTFFVLFTSFILMLLAVFIHLGAMRAMYATMTRWSNLNYYRVGLLVVVAIIAHLIEICLFAVGIGILASSGVHGQLDGAYQPGFTDNLYYSAITYTALGFGDITPTDALRLFTAIEALTGLVLIAWTAAALFPIMQQYWRDEKRRRDSRLS